MKEIDRKRVEAAVRDTLRKLRPADEYYTEAAAAWDAAVDEFDAMLEALYPDHSQNWRRRVRQKK